MIKYIFLTNEELNADTTILAAIIRYKGLSRNNFSHVIFDSISFIQFGLNYFKYNIRNKKISNIIDITHQAQKYLNLL